MDDPADVVIPIRPEDGDDVNNFEVQDIDKSAATEDGGDLDNSEVVDETAAAEDDQNYSEDIDEAAAEDGSDLNNSEDLDAAVAARNRVMISIGPTDVNSAVSAGTSVDSMDERKVQQVCSIQRINDTFFRSVDLGLNPGPPARKARALTTTHHLKCFKKYCLFNRINFNISIVRNDNGKDERTSGSRTTKAALVNSNDIHH